MDFVKINGNSTDLFHSISQHMYTFSSEKELWLYLDFNGSLKRIFVYVNVK